jgi:fatty-acyl-CoA synthase
MQELSIRSGGDQPALMDQCIGETLDQAAQRHPDAPALIVRQQRKRYTYQELLEDVDLVARGFLQLGVQKGDRIGIWATNCAEWVLTQFATAKIGAILVNINPAYRAYELEYALKQSECQTLLLIEGFRDCDYVQTISSIAPEVSSCSGSDLRSKKLPHLRTLICLGGNRTGMLNWNDLVDRGREVPDEDLRNRESLLVNSDPINIQYTSGTTGFPKGAVLTHHSLVNNAQFIGHSMKITHEDKICIPVPFYHCFGMVLGNMVSVVAGAAMVIPAAYFDSLATLEAVAEERCTALYGVPTMFIAQLEHPRFEEFDLSSLRTGIMAGSPCPLELMKQVVDRMNCRELTIAYGLTEASPVITQTTTEDPIELRVATVGKPLPHTEVRIAHPGTGTPVPLGEPGELWTRGYLVMKGYYKNDEATREAIDSDGWLHSGDLATMDTEGYCRIRGRIKDMIIRGGENIYPREIEEFLYTCERISDVQVIGIPDRKYGEAVMAWIKLKEGCSLTEEEVQNFCRGKIATYKIPRYIKFVSEFPTTVTGKVQKFKMRAMAIEELGLHAEAHVETA